MIITVQVPDVSPVWKAVLHLIGSITFGVHDSLSPSNIRRLFSKAANVRSVIILHPSASVIMQSILLPNAADPDIRKKWINIFI